LLGHMATAPPTLFVQFLYERNVSWLT
jgi:hypothetical protein